MTPLKQIDDGQVLIESNVICMYLDEKHPEPALQPRDPLQRARMRLWMKQLDDSVHAATGTASTCVAFRHQHLRKTPAEIDAYFAKVPEERRVRMRQAVDLGVAHTGEARRQHGDLAHDLFVVDDQDRTTAPHW